MKKPFSVCNKEGCIELTREAYCDKHKGEKKEQARLYRTNIRKKKHVAFYNSKEWQQVREQALIRDAYLCVECKKVGSLTKARIVDHVIELEENFELRSEISNLESLCDHCHNRKTQRMRRLRGLE